VPLLNLVKDALVDDWFASHESGPPVPSGTGCLASGVLPLLRRKRCGAGFPALHAAFATK
jgi:hypothetical protein